MTNRTTCSFTARRVLIAGVGYVGSALASRLLADGCTVFGIGRTPDAMPEGVRPIAADLTRPETLVPPGALDAAVFLAAPRSSDAAAYRATYVDGSRNLLEALDRVGMPPRLIFASSTSVYGQTDGSWVDEDTPLEPGVLAEAEHLWREHVVVRFGGIYGPGRTRLIEQVRRGDARLPASPMYTNRLHRDDCAGALVHLLSLPEPLAVYNGVDRDPADLADVLRFIAAELGLPDPPVGDAASSLRRGGNKRVRGDRLVASGYSHRHPTFREGYRELLTSSHG